MDVNDLPYLRDIHSRLRGSIAPAVVDPTAGRLLACIEGLIASVVAEREHATQDVDTLLTMCRRELPQMKTILAGNPEGMAQLTRLESACASGDRLLVAGAAARLAPRLLGRGEQAAQRLLTLLVEHETKRWHDIDETALSFASATKVAGREVEPFTGDERERLLTLLREQCGEGDQLALDTVTSLSGGFSKQTIMVSLLGNRMLPNRIVIRRDRADSPAATTVLDEFDLLRTLHAAGVAVPQPFAVDNGRVSGNPLMVVSHEAGGIIADAFDVFDRSRALAVPTLARQLATIHNIPLAALSRPLPGHDMTHQAQLYAEISGFHDHWKALGESSIVIETAFEWIYAHRDRFDGERCITHRDLRFHNVLSDDAGVTAIIDWELAAVGRAARDLGYVYHQVAQFGDWNDFLAAYEAAGGLIPAAGEIDFYILWADLSVALYMYMARANYQRGNTGNILFAYAGERMRQHSLRILSARMHRFLHDGSATEPP